MPFPDLVPQAMLYDARQSRVAHHWPRHGLPALPMPMIEVGFFLLMLYGTSH